MIIPFIVLTTQSYISIRNETRTYTQNIVIFPSYQLDAYGFYSGAS